ncbi:hypothetical protein HK405_012266, partial [Cladochytrium tenue]
MSAGAPTSTVPPASPAAASPPPAASFATADSARRSQRALIETRLVRSGEKD